MIDCVESFPTEYYAAMAQVLPVLVLGHILASARYGGWRRETGIRGMVAGLAVVGLALGGVAEGATMWALYNSEHPVEFLRQAIPAASVVNFLGLIACVAAIASHADPNQ